MMNKCPECGKDVIDDWKTCPNCGFPLDAENNNDVASDVEEPLKSVHEVSSQEKKSKKKSIYVIVGIIVVVIIIAICVIKGGGSKKDEGLYNGIAWGTSYEDLSLQFAEAGDYTANDDRKMVFENITDYNGDEGVNATIGYYCGNDGTLSEVDVFLTYVNSDYSEEELYLKYKDQYTSMFGDIQETDADASLVEWTTSKSIISLKTFSDDILLISYTDEESNEILSGFTNDEIYVINLVLEFKNTLDYPDSLTLESDFLIINYDGHTCCFVYASNDTAESESGAEDGVVFFYDGSYNSYWRESDDYKLDE